MDREPVLEIMVSWGAGEMAMLGLKDKAELVGLKAGRVCSGAQHLQRPRANQEEEGAGERWLPLSLGALSEAGPQRKVTVPAHSGPEVKHQEQTAPLCTLGTQ